MPILKRPEQLVVDRINLENSTALTVADVQFFIPKVPTTDEDIDLAGGRNTVVRIAATPLANATGATYVYYNRLNFTQMFTDASGAQPMNVPVRRDTVYTARDLVPFVNQYYGLMLQPSDIKDLSIDRAGWVVDFEAEENSLGWIGKVPVYLTEGDALLEPQFTTLNIAPYAYPQFNTKLGQGAVYSYPYRFDTYAAELKAMGTAINEVRLAQILKLVTGDAWSSYRSPVDFNIREALISYNGRNSRDFPTNPSVDNVLVVELSLYCNNFGGRLYLHYNDPE